MIKEEYMDLSFIWGGGELDFCKIEAIMQSSTHSELVYKLSRIC